MIIIIHAPARSGHHAIIHWMQSSMNNISLFMNRSSFEEKKFSKNPFLYVNGNQIIKNDLDKFEKLNKKENIKIDTLITNLEQHDIIETDKMDFNEFINWNSYKKLKLNLKNYYIKHIIINRDIYNFLASKKMRMIKWKSTLDWKELSQNLLIPQWKKMVKVSLGEIKTINNYYSINFNKWFCCNDYRDKIINDLNLNKTKYTEIAKLKIVSEGKSSFTEGDFDLKADQMNVLERYKEFINNDEYLSVFDKECHNLNEKYFGFKI